MSRLALVFLANVHSIERLTFDSRYSHVIDCVPILSLIDVALPFVPTAFI